jgi:hypothetical protein
MMAARRGKAALLCAAALLALLAGCTTGDGGNGDQARLDSAGKDFILKAVTRLEKVAAITGAESPNKTDQYAVYGTDLGSMFNDGDRTYFVFGDTFGERPPEQIGGGGSFWRSNTIGYATDADPADGITLDGMIVDDIGLAKELLPSKKIDFDEMTKIPTHGLAANDAYYLYYMSVSHWGNPGEWDAGHAGVAKSVDGGQNWTFLEQLQWPGDSGFIQVSPYKIVDGGEPEIYFWGIPSGRFGGVQLMKVKEADIESQGAYRYYAGTGEDGEPVWSASLTDAKTVVDDTVGELSVVWNDYLERWIMTYLKEGTGVVIREGLAPWGPWGDPVELVKASEHPGLYGPYMNERYTADGGQTIYFTLSLWDPYNVYWYKATLEK